MSRKRTARRPLLAGLIAAVAALGLLLSTTISFAAAATPVAVYDAIGPTVPSNFTPSLGFDAQPVNELGDLVTLAPGPRELKTVSVALSSQACDNRVGHRRCATTDPQRHSPIR